MRLLVLSDLHLEHGAFAPPAAERFDAVILAGDICQGPHAVRWAREQPAFAGRPVVLVPGNHEFYGLERIDTLNLMRQSALGSNVHVLDRDELMLPDAAAASAGASVRVLGATLWTDFEALGPDAGSAMSRAQRGLNDFAGAILERASDRVRLFTPEDSLAEHRRSRAWLLERLAAPVAPEIATVVVTHHGPSARSVAAQYVGNALTPCFVSELPAPFFAQPLLWVHGHVHTSFDYRSGRTRVVTNPRGYRRRGGFENVDFRSDLVIEVPTRSTA